MTEIVVIVPVLNRPQRALLVAQSLARASALSPRLLFVCSPDDDAQIEACKQTGADILIADWQPGHADFQRKINHAYRTTSEEFIFQGADDLEFGSGWDMIAVAEIERTVTGVCGTNDDANPRVRSGLHSTHSLIRRSYIDECGASYDGPGSVFSEAYGHQWCDNELVELAKWRDCFSFAERSIVSHFHPIWRTAGDDDTYRKGAATSAADARLFHERQRAWMREAA